MRIRAAAAALLLASCYEPGGQCTADTDCLSDQVCGVDGLCAPGVRPPPGNPPEAADDSYAFEGNGPFEVTGANGVLKNDVDPEGAALTAELVANATYGQVFLAPDGSFRYAPSLGFDGTDTFTYRATNGDLVSGEATVSISVVAPPVAVLDGYAFLGAGPFAVTATDGVLKNDADPNGGALTAVLVVTAAHGTLALAADGSFTYAPAAGFNGQDAFTYQARAGTLSSWVTTVSITVVAPPAAAADAYTFAGAGPFAVAAPGVLQNDSDPNAAALSAALVAGPASGQVTLAADGSFTYTPNPGFTGQDGFTYRAIAGTLSSAAAAVTITVQP